MTNFTFKKWNNITGWSLFALALGVYFKTAEPTMSFWDCGEYISTSAKLQAGHPPGAPLFQMLGAIFAGFALNVKQVAFAVNMVSVLASAFTILFMFWSLTLLLTDLTAAETEKTEKKNFMILGASAIGSLAFLFSDSFWFSATEAEVYALASLLIALMLWCGLRWGRDMHKPQGNRWLLLISMLVGLSFGVHFLALLTIPSLSLIYYFKNYGKITIKNFIIANIAMVALLFFVFAFLMPYTMAFFGKTEIFVVNNFGLPFNSGTLLAFAILAGAFWLGLRVTRQKGWALPNTAILCVLFILIGASSWIMLPIRANAHIVINENNPNNAAELLAYYNREQYPEQKTFYGPLYTEAYAGLDAEEPYVDEKPNYERNDKTGKYEIVNQYKGVRQNMDNAHKGFLPRMNNADMAANYMEFAGPPSFRINPEYDFSNDLAHAGVNIEELSDEEAAQAIGSARAQLEGVIAEFRAAYAKGEMGNAEYDKFLKNYGRYLIVDKPTLSQNLAYMMDYQFGYMYLRYLMWNFSGRQNDEQGTYDYLNGNWLSGIPAIDDARLGPQEQITPDALNNKGRNIYYMLPLILGIIGLIYHARKDLKSFYIFLVLFLFTGIALVIFLNERPFEPRERDYALVGSFYVFAIWIALGAFALQQFTQRYLKAKMLAPVALALALFAGPVLMATQNWDDHNRDDRYTAVALAKAYLDSCDKNAILFTVADNDTFPLWYAQEVEGYRTDVRVVCAELLNADWYIDMMKRKAYTSEALPISFNHEQYRAGTRDYIIYDPRTDKRIDINEFMDFIHLDDERATVALEGGKTAHAYPANKVRFNVDRNTVLKNKVVPQYKYDSIVPYIDVDLPTGAIYKGGMAMLDIIRNNNWERPICFSGRSNDDADYGWMKPYLQAQGLVLKLVPVRTEIPEDARPSELGYVNTEKSYDTVKHWDWGNSGNPKIYHDPETRHNGITFRTNMARLSDTLIAEGKFDKAREIIDLAMEKMPVDLFGYYSTVTPFADGYYKTGDKGKARALLAQLTQKYQDSLGYYRSLPASQQNTMASSIVTDIERYRYLLLVMQDNGDTALYEREKKTFNSYNQRFSRFGRKDEI